MALNQEWTIKMTPQDKTFYKALGKRISEARKAQGLTQVQLAEVLGISQQTMAHYEGGVLRIAVATLAVLAKTLTIPVEELIGEAAASTKNKRGPVSKLQLQIEQIGLMPRSKQKFITEMLDAMIRQQSA